MQKRPILQLHPTPTDTLLEALGYLSLLATWALALYHFKSLPDTIPTHFNLEGKANAFGSKTTLLMLPLIATVVFIVMTMITKHPHKYNYPFTITEDNALSQYTIAASMIRYAKLSSVLAIGFILFQIIRNANQPDTGLGSWFLPMILVLILLPIVYFSIQSWRAR